MQIAKMNKSITGNSSYGIPALECGERVYISPADNLPDVGLYWARSVHNVPDEGFTSRLVHEDDFDKE